MPGRVARGCAVVLATVLTCFAGSAVAGGYLCKDEPELSAWKAALGGKARRKLEDRGDVHRGLLASYETMLGKASQGDPQSRHHIGRWWAICQLGEGKLGADQQRKTIEYLRTGEDSDSRQTLTLLALFSAMGWGGPIDSEAAYRQFEAARANAVTARRPSLEEFVAEANIRSAPAEQQRAAYVFTAVLKELVATRPTTTWAQIVPGRERFEDGIPVEIAVQTCPSTTEVISTLPTGADAAATQQFFQSLVAQVPTAGLPCDDDAGEPYQQVLEATLFPPDPDPFAGR
ncbi:hypothetical protein [Lysobacter fragariae]